MNHRRVRAPRHPQGRTSRGATKARRKRKKRSTRDKNSKSRSRSPGDQSSQWDERVLRELRSGAGGRAEETRLMQTRGPSRETTEPKEEPAEEERAFGETSEASVQIVESLRQRQDHIGPYVTFGSRVLLLRPSELPARIVG